MALLGAPGFVGDPQVLGRERGAVGLAQPLLDKGGDVDLTMASARDALTFTDLIEDHLADIAKRRGSKHVRDVRYALTDKALPQLGHMRPKDVRAIDIQGVVDAVYDRGAQAMARHLLTYLRAVFNNVIKGNPELQAKYGLEVNPADRVGRGGRYETQRVDERYLTDAEIVLFWRALSQSAIDERTQLVLKLLLLTGQRPSEVRCAEAGELRLDGEHPEWHLPGIVREKGKPPKRRTKNGLPHLVPLPPLPANLFRRAVELAADAPVLFPSDIIKDGILGEYTLGQATRRLIESGKLACKPFSPKDLRTTVKTGMARLGISREVRRPGAEPQASRHRRQGL